MHPKNLLSGNVVWSSRSLRDEGPRHTFGEKVIEHATQPGLPYHTDSLQMGKVKSDK